MSGRQVDEHLVYGLATPVCPGGFVNATALSFSSHSSCADSAFAFLKLVDMSPGEVHGVYTSPLLERLLQVSEREHVDLDDEVYAMWAAPPFRINNAC